MGRGHRACSQPKRRLHCGHREGLAEHYRRRGDPRDTVRQEIAAVLKRQMRVFPVLVGGARMPAEEDLSADLQALCRWNASELPEKYWDVAVQDLIKALETAFAPSAQPRTATPPPARRTW